VPKRLVTPIFGLANLSRELGIDPSDLSRLADEGDPRRRPGFEDRAVIHRTQVEQAPGVLASCRASRKVARR
jgi:hypothetical protein